MCNPLFGALNKFRSNRCDDAFWITTGAGNIDIMVIGCERVNLNRAVRMRVGNTSCSYMAYVVQVLRVVAIKLL